NLQKNRSWWFKKWAKKGFPMKPQEYLNLNRPQWEAFKQRDSNAAYTIGYSLVYFMMSRKDTEVVLKELLWEFKKQGKKANSIKVINEVYPGGIERFERIWLKWIPRVRPYRPLRSLRKETEKKIGSSAN
ncbi:MAG: hypothetical protein ACYST9_06580, partial [Planctomycetota bacterium]